MSKQLDTLANAFPSALHSPARMIAPTDTDRAYALLKPQGELQVLPSHVIHDALSMDEIHTFMHHEGIYVLPTVELAEFWAHCIAHAWSAIEIGAGNGALAKHLGLRATDSFMQCPKRYKPAKIHRELWQAFLASNPPVKYGDNVIQAEAQEAVKRFKPSLVLGCYITHKYFPAQHERGGNVLGVDAVKLFKSKCVQRYVMVGNLITHKDNPMMDLPMMAIELDGLITRSPHPALNRVFVWDKANNFDDFQALLPTIDQ